MPSFDFVGSSPTAPTYMESVAQQVERQIVALEVMGSNPIFLPIEKAFDYYQMIASEAF